MKNSERNPISILLLATKTRLAPKHLSDATKDTRIIDLKKQRPDQT